MTVHHAASNAHHEASDPRACTEADRVIAAFVFAKVATEDKSDGLALVIPQGPRENNKAGTLLSTV
jgi:hypothetical protein